MLSILVAHGFIVVWWMFQKQKKKKKDVWRVQTALLLPLGFGLSQAVWKK